MLSEEEAEIRPMRLVAGNLDAGSIVTGVAVGLSVTRQLKVCA